MKTPEDFKREQRGIAVRLLVWSAIFAWAVWKMGPHVNKPNGSWPLTRPTDAAASAPPVDLPDVEAALQHLDRVALEARNCPAKGVLRVRIGATGLVEATLEGSGDTSCVAAVAWRAPWPASRQELVLERSVE